MNSTRYDSHLPVNYNTSFQVNLSHQSNGSDWRNPDIIQGRILPWPLVTLLVCVVGCFNGAIVLSITWQRATDKSGVNLLIFHFVAVNFFMCLVNYPIRCVMVQARQFGHIVPVQACTYFQTAMSVCWLVIYWSDAGLSVNRALALLSPHRYKRYSTPRNNIFHIVFIWLMCIAVYLPIAFEIGSRTVVLPHGHCGSRNTANGFAQFYTVFSYLPYGISGFSSIAILSKCYLMTKSSAVQQYGRENRRNLESMQHRIRLAKVLVLTFPFTLFCNVPFAVLVARWPYLFQTEPLQVLWVQESAVVQYAFTPCIFLMSSRYRDQLWRLGERFWPRVLNGSATHPLAKPSRGLSSGLNSNSYDSSNPPLRHHLVVHVLSASSSDLFDA